MQLLSPACAKATAGRPGKFDVRRLHSADGPLHLSVGRWTLDVGRFLLRCFLSSPPPSPPRPPISSACSTKASNASSSANPIPSRSENIPIPISKQSVSRLMERGSALIRRARQSSQARHRPRSKSANSLLGLRHSYSILLRSSFPCPRATFGSDRARTLPAR